MLYLLVRVADQRVALPASAIEAVVELEAVAPVPRVAPHIAGLAALRSRIVTVVDVRAALQLPAGPLRRPLEAVIVNLDGHSYGLVVDAVEDVADAGSPQPLRVPLADGWAAAAQGSVEIAGALALVLDPEALILPRAAAAA